MTPRDRRALVVGGAITAAALFGLRLAPWVVRFLGELHQRVAMQAESLARAQDDIRQAQLLVDSGGVLKAKVLALAPRILSGSTGANATADLSGRLHAAAGNHRVRVERTDVIPDSTRAGGLQQVVVRAMLESDSRGTLEMLRELTRSGVVVSLRDLRIMAIDPNSPDRSPEVLRTEVTVQGWFLNRGPVQ